jgi:hypothetical protein
MSDVSVAGTGITFAIEIAVDECFTEIPIPDFAV